MHYARNASDISLGKDPQLLNNDLEAAIRQVCSLREKYIISAMSAYQSRQGSFYSAFVISKQHENFTISYYTALR